MKYSRSSGVNGFGHGANMIVSPPCFAGMSLAKPIPCHSSSVMNGMNGWKSRSVCEKT